MFFSRCFYQKQHKIEKAESDSPWIQEGCKGLAQGKITVLTLGFKPATFQLQAQHPNPLSITLPPVLICLDNKCCLEIKQHCLFYF